MRTAYLVAAGCVTACSSWAGADDPGTPQQPRPLAGLAVNVQVDLSKDDGRNIGTLFELRDSAGRAVAGAGVVSVCNSNVRGDRMQLNVYLRQAVKDPPPLFDRLPRPSVDAGCCIFTRDNLLYSLSYRHKNTDQLIRRFDPGVNQWQVDERLRGAGVLVAGKFLEPYGNSTLYDGARSFYRGIEHGGFGLYHYAAGTLFMWNYRVPGSGANRLIACSWTPGQSEDIDPAQGVSLSLANASEFPYCYGKLGNCVLVGTSNGALHAFERQAWREVRQADVTTGGYQFYSMINYEDQLLIGSYPSGFLWSWDGERLEQLADWPPVHSSASPAEREAQTMFIHGGELYVGLWPWGELWRLDRVSRQWSFVARMFSAPPMTKEHSAPFASQAAIGGGPYNRLGQRVLGMAALGDALYVSTSAKSADPAVLKEDFLPAQLREEYGSVLRLKLGCNLAAALTWSPQPIKVQVRFHADAIDLLQDGREIATLPVEREIMSQLSITDVQWSRGVFGQCEFPISETSIASPAKP